MSEQNFSIYFWFRQHSDSSTWKCIECVAAPAAASCGKQHS